VRGSAWLFCSPGCRPATDPIVRFNWLRQVPYQEDGRPSRAFHWNRQPLTTPDAAVATHQRSASLLLGTKRVQVACEKPCIATAHFPCPAFRFPFPCPCSAVHDAPWSEDADSASRVDVRTGLTEGFHHAQRSDAAEQRGRGVANSLRLLGDYATKLDKFECG
jgi:hypothetical protein